MTTTTKVWRPSRDARLASRGHPSCICAMCGEVCGSTTEHMIHRTLAHPERRDEQEAGR